MERLVRLWKGYVRIRITGYSPERFLNLCNKRNIVLYAVRYEENGYTMEVSRRDFFCLKKMLRKTGTQIHILGKQGLPFFLFRYRRHKGLVLSLAGCFLLLLLLSQCLWEVEVSGNYRLTDTQLIQYLKEQGIETGVRLAKIDCQNLEEALREHYPEVIWASARIEGTRLYLSIQEIKEESSGIVKTELGSSDLVASHAGTVVSIVTRKGMPLVKAGEQVEMGDILVSGCMELYDDYETLTGYAYCDADADVVLHIEEAYTDQIPIFYDKKIPTGRTKKQIRIIFGEQILSFGERQPAYEACTVTTEQIPLIIGSHFQFPFELVKISTSEVTYEQTRYTETMLKQMLAGHYAVYSRKLEKKGFQIIDKDVKIKLNEKEVLVSGTLQMEYKETMRQDTIRQDRKEEEGLDENGIDTASNGDSGGTYVKCIWTI